MNSNNVNRNDFKWNFLKTIVLRLDFSGAFDAEIEGILPQIKSYLKEKDFDRYSENESNQVDINLDDNIQEGSSIPVKDFRKIKFYSFTNEKKGFTFDLSKKFICLRVSTNNYVKYEEYSALFFDLVNIFSSSIDFFTPTRFGFRKINFCLLDELEDIPTYFNNAYFNYVNPFDDSQISINETKRLIIVDSKKMNIFSTIQRGTIKDPNNNRNIYKVSLDTDIYLDNESDINKLFTDSKNLDEINNLAFKIYVDTLTDKMISILCGEDEIPEGLSGVDKND